MHFLTCFVVLSSVYYNSFKIILNFRMEIIMLIFLLNEQFLNFVSQQNLALKQNLSRFPSYKINKRRVAGKESEGTPEAFLQRLRVVVNIFLKTATREGEG